MTAGTSCLHPAHAAVTSSYSSVASSPSSNTVALTENAIKRLQAVAREGEVLRVTVESGGCSGFQYKLDLVERNELDSSHRVIETDGVGLAVDDVSEQFLLGAQVDYVKDLLSSSFRVVNNQAAEDACSCGVSFSPK
eukprot:CAMPEP_0177668704 /NCGR_PEP_ID=MMETSP0447-20121125/22949_1 /TAXON_ID=0 /ORGANISM="Stygamoeba regulata, Strain BSH-02190019" /LENGTH=136 /DNA_ID=CAMNT_0019175321 /DNA_START=312 /DNA_END=722 /DNA_ORIENTATION=-